MPEHIAPFILFKEYRCPCCNSLPPDFDLENVLKGYEKLFENFKEIREEWGKAIPITSGYRCTKRQLELYNQGISSTPYSTHIFGLALDLRCKSEDDVRMLVATIKKINPHLRIGYQRYFYGIQRHIHIDLGQFIHPRFSEKLREGARW